MATKSKESAYDSNSKYEIAVYGYIRTNFSADAWVNEIIQIILQFYWGCGSLYTFGSGKYGCLGILKYAPYGYQTPICKEPTLCPPFNKQNTLDVAAGSDHTLILDIDGNVWTCGYGESGKLGTGKEQNELTPICMCLEKNVIAVAAGHSHSLILLENGCVKSFGLGKYGALGHGNKESLLVPRTIKSLKKYKIVQVSAGTFHSCALSEDGDLFCFGDNEHGQCGVGKANKVFVVHIMTPTKVKFKKEVSFVACGSEHTLLITCKGLIHSFGNGDCGDLGHGSEKNKYTPTLIKALKQQNMTSCAAGQEHSICMNKEGIVWAFGYNREGQCGQVKDIEEQLTPKVIEYFVSNNIKAIDCDAGGRQSCVISEDGSLYVFGYNDKFQLGLKGAEQYYTPTKLSLPQNMCAQKVSMGDKHTAVICNDPVFI